jgi:branched-chain amino acid transport system ATP-binding protein
MPDVLTVSDLYVAYGPIKAVRGCSFRLSEGETVAIVGANGAGKTTIMRALSNLIPRERGSVLFDGRPTASMSVHVLARAGLLHVPEGRGVIGRLSVLENLRIAYDMRPHARGYQASLAATFDRFPVLGERRSQRAGSLSGGEQQMLALARAIMNPPRLLLLDEPSLGLAPRMVREVLAVLSDFQRSGMAILLVEQNVGSALALAHRAYVLRQGQIALEGTGTELLRDEGALRQLLVARPRAGSRPGGASGRLV